MNSQGIPPSRALGEPGAAPRQIVVVDSRDPSIAPLRDLLPRARALGVTVVATTLEQAVCAVSSVSRASFLIHLGVDSRAGRGGGAVVAVELRRRAPSLPIVLYTGAPDPASAPAFSSLVPATPIVSDVQLASNLEVIVSRAARAAERAYALRCAIARFSSRAADARTPRFPARFRILQFEAEVERAIALLAVQSRGTGHDAASAIGRSERSLAQLITRYDLQPPVGGRSPLTPSSRPTMAWVHSPAGDARVALSGEAGEVEVVHVATGALSPRRLEPADVSCALVRVDDAAAALDAWKCANSPRGIPWAMHGAVTSPLELLLSALQLRPPLELEGEELAEVAAAVASAGAAGRDLARALHPLPGTPARDPSGELLNLDSVLEQASDGVALAAYDVTRSETKAAELVGLPARTYAYRLKRARSRRGT
jgi:hypothetical protein